MVNRMRSTPGHTGNRRSHHALSEPRLSKCECGAQHVRHRACSECGMYRGKQVLDVVARTEREARRTKKREQNLQAMGMAGNPGAHEHSHDEDKKEETK